MAAINRATIRETIRFLGDFKNVRKFPDTDLNTEIQRKFDRFWAIVDEANEGWWDTEGNVNTVTGQAYIALPTDAKAVKGVGDLPKVGVVSLCAAAVPCGPSVRAGSAWTCCRS